MERITKRIDETHACYAICERECPDGIYEDNPACKCTASHMALKRLLEYEDTGLTPQEIMKLKERDTAKAANKKLRHRGGFETFHCPNCDTSYQIDRRYTITDEYCPKCGKLLDSSFRSFCANCGQRLEDGR